jgi:serine/threonine protein kinase, bacterial
MSNSPVIIETKELSFQLKEQLDFELLYDLGEVFCVFDKQDSGNICFGVKINNQKDSLNILGQEQ